MSESLHVWGSGTARTFRVYWALSSLDLPYISHPIKTRTEDMERKSFLAVSPGKKIPAITHGKRILTESAAILEYLFRISKRNPTDFDTAIEIDRWSHFILMEIDATALYVLRRHEDLSTIYGEAPNACSAARNYFHRQINVLDNLFENDNLYFLGNNLTKVDILLGSCCLWSQSINLKLPENISRWFRKIQTLGSYKSGLRANYD